MAKWIINEYTVSFDEQGEVISEEIWLAGQRKSENDLPYHKTVTTMY